MIRALIFTAMLTILLPGCGDAHKYPLAEEGAICRMGMSPTGDSLAVDFWCSAMIVAHENGETLVLTAKHCECEVNSNDLREWKLREGKLFIQVWDPAKKAWGDLVPVDRSYVHPSRDVALMVVKGIYGTPVPMACKAPQVYQDCYNLGVFFSPDNEMVRLPMPTRGSVMGLFDDADRLELLTSAPIVPGYSGGGLVAWCDECQRWECIGINSRVIATRFGAAIVFAVQTPVYDVAEWVWGAIWGGEGRAVQE